MKKCETIRAQIALYLDDELHDGELAEFDAHRQACPACGSLCERERRVLENIRAAKPLYGASPELRERIEETLRQSGEPFVTPGTLRHRVSQILWPDRILPFALRPRRALAYAAVLGAILFAGVWLMMARRSVPSPSEFARMAVDTHVRRLRNQLPLEIVTDSPVKISDWFAGKVSFSLKLPNYQEASGQEKLYRLEGARLVGFKQDYAAFVAYQMQRRPITLVVTSNAVAMPSGGEQVMSKGLKFHYDAINGLKVITWADRGLTYALVSDLEERGQQSCIVCHEGTKDRDFIESLKPARFSF